MNFVSRIVVIVGHSLRNLPQDVGEGSARMNERTAAALSEHLSRLTDSQAAEAQRALSKLLSRIVLLDHAKCKPNTPAFDYLRKNSRLCAMECIKVDDDVVQIREDLRRGHIINRNQS